MHDCRNSKHCPICGQKRKDKIIKIFKENPKTNFIISDFVRKEYSLNSWESARNVLYSLEKRGIIIRTYKKTKRLTIGKGIHVYFNLNPNEYRVSQVKSKSWIKVF